ncbi:MAG: hypothetical protein ACJ760_16010 [Thermoleophilaceae bacterium]
MGIAAYVTVPGAASGDELEAMAAELRAAGLEFDRIEAGEERLTGVEEILSVVVVVPSLSGFFTGFAEEAGKDAYKALKRLVSRVAGKGRRTDDGVVVVQDQQTRARADLTPQLDDAAYSALFELDFDALQEGTLAWDGAAGRWRPSA